MSEKSESLSCQYW